MGLAGFGRGTIRVYVLDGNWEGAHAADLADNLIDVGALARVLFQHPADEGLDAVGKGRVMGVFERGIQDGHVSDVLERGCVVAQLVQQDTEGPDVTLLVNGLSPPDIDHFGGTVLHGGMALDVLLNQTAFGSIGGRSTGRGGTAKVTQLVGDGLGSGRDGDENVLDLEVAMQQGRLQVVHCGDAFADVGEDVEDLGLGQTVLQTGVHKVNQTTAGTVLHEQEDLVATALELAGMAVYVANNVLVALQTLHRLDFGTHVGQGILVRDGDTLEDGDRGLVVWRGDADDIDVSKAALGQVFLNRDSV